MMEPLTALGLASNVVQFVHFASSLISSGSEIAQSAEGATRETLELEQVFDSLHTFNSDFCRLSNAPTSNARDFTTGDGAPVEALEMRRSIESLRNLAIECNVLCEELLEMLRKIRAKKTSLRPFTSLSVALKTMWHSDNIQNLERRIDRFQGAITLHLFPLLR